ncbi:MAG: EamA family transporter [Solirubrobacteraceae bacterium]|nr:EamA family transporter [Solirubrobacteraceae bacterium]
MRSTTTAPAIARLAGSGVGASIFASFAFAAIFVLARELDDFGSTPLYAWRVVISIVLIAAVFTLARQWPLVRAVVERLRAEPLLVPVLIANATFFGFQLWLFGWAPQAGRALEVALGYLLMPLVLVMIGVVMHRERVSRLRAGALGAAAVGVAAAVFLAGGIGWPTTAVFVGYPIYFASRRAAGLDSMGVIPLEFAVMTPFALVVLAVDRDATAPLADAPHALGIVLLGVLSAGAFLAYLRAGQVLPFSIFGLLAYLEPILLVGVATLILGETFTDDELLVYGPILVGLALLAVDVRRTSAND